MSLWVDKYRPTKLEQLHYHPELSGNLQQLAKGGDIPHLLLFGPSGAGKKTRVMCFLRAIYGSAVEKLKIEHKTFKPDPSKSKTVTINTIASNYHVEINPHDVGNDDYHVVRCLLKEIALTQQLDSSQRSFKVVVISEADKMTRKAQQALRRIMEKYVSTCRYILVCNSTSKVLDPILSRCLAVRVAAPTCDEICTVLQHVAKKEHVTLPPALALRIAQESGRNLRRAVLMMETCKVQQSPMTAEQQIVQNDWETYLADTAKIILREQSPQRLLEVRGRLYELITHCIPADVIIKTLTAELIRNLDGQLKVEITRQAAAYEHRLQCGTKEIFHLEAFVAKFMSVYKRYLMELMM